MGVLCCGGDKNIDNFKPTKGFHFEQGPYVEYEGTIEDSQTLIPMLEEAINQLAAQDLKTFAADLSPEEAQSQGIQPQRRAGDGRCVGRCAVPMRCSTAVAPPVLTRCQRLPAWTASCASPCS